MRIYDLKSQDYIVPASTGAVIMERALRKGPLSLWERDRVRESGLCQSTNSPEEFK
jgi:hypothetical protein